MNDRPNAAPPMEENEMNDTWVAPPKPANAQCTECSVDEPYPLEIRAQGVFCGGCGRTRPSTVYRFAAPSSDAAPTRTLPEKLIWARAILNIHRALTDAENEKVKQRIAHIAATWAAPPIDIQGDTT